MKKTRKTAKKPNVVKSLKLSGEQQSALMTLLEIIIKLTIATEGDVGASASFIHSLGTLNDEKPLFENKKYMFECMGELFEECVSTEDEESTLWVKTLAHLCNEKANNIELSTHELSNIAYLFRKEHPHDSNEVNSTTYS